jgi:hypothetical protein
MLLPSIMPLPMGLAREPLSDAEYWKQRIIDELAQAIVGLAGLLRAMPVDPDDPMWLDLHLRLKELGPVLPREYSVLAHIIDGLDDFQAPAEP